MYQVITLYGDTEPWWFLEGWEEDIIETELFEDLEDARQRYQAICDEYALLYEKQETRQGHLAAFWDPKDQSWCDDCDEYLQQYHSVMLLEVRQSRPVAYRKGPQGRRIKPCMLK